MRKLFPILLVLVLLGALAAYYLSKPQSDSTISKTANAFAVEDTSAIGIIHIQNKDFPKLTLKRAESGWWHINDKWLARQDKIDLLLETLTKMRAVKPIANAATANITEGMKTATSVDILDTNGQPLKSYFLSGSNSKRDGNHMKIKGEDQIFLVKIPGFVGYFSPRFIPRIIDWRSPKVFNHGPDNIEELTIEYPEEPNESFSIKRQGEEFKFSRLQSSHPKDATVKQNLLRGYLKSFRNLNAEAFENEYEKQDSLREATPFAKVSLMDVNGNNSTATIYKRKVYRRTKVKTEADGKQREYDIDRYFAFVNEDRDFVLIQDYVFGPIFRRHKEFLPR